MMQSTAGALADSMSPLSSSSSTAHWQHPAFIAEEYWRQMLPSSSLTLSVDAECDAASQQESTACTSKGCDKDSETTDASENAFEPSLEPCSGDIPFADLVFWLGDATTGRVDACSCTSCWKEWQRARVQRRQRHKLAYSPYGRLSSKIPVINLPRIEGVN